MPNWSEGVLKIRGTKEQIENFIRNGIAYEDYKFNLGTDKQGNRGLIETSVPRDCPIEIGEDEITVKNTIDLYIKDTRRMFINSKDIYTYYITLCMGIDTAVRFGCTCIFKRQRNHRTDDEVMTVKLAPISLPEDGADEEEETPAAPDSGVNFGGLDTK